MKSRFSALLALSAISGWVLMTSGTPPTGGAAQRTISGKVTNGITGADIGENLNFADPRLVKAGWNWNLGQNDGSRGVHNPTFVFTFMDLAIDAMNALANEAAGESREQRYMGGRSVMGSEPAPRLVH